MKRDVVTQSKTQNENNNYLHQKKKAFGFFSYILLYGTVLNYYELKN